MKSTLIKISIVASIAIGVVIGCSSDSGDGGSATVVPPSTITSETVAVMLDSVAQIDGCEKVIFQTAPLFDHIANPTEEDAASEENAPSLSYPINTTAEGTCGGSLSITGEHDGGTDTLLYSYIDFCSDYEDRKVTSSGQLNVLHKGTPSDLGPIVYEDTISTSGELTEQFDKNDGSTASYQVSMSRYSQHFSDGDKATSATQTNPDTITISSAYAIDSDGERYSTSNVRADVFVESSTINVVTGEALFAYPGLGTYTLETDGMLSIPVNSVDLPTWAHGNLTMIGTDNTRGAIEITEDGIITVIIDNNISSAQQVDCSQFLNDIQQ